LHQVFVQHLPEFLAAADEQGGLPKFVRRELEGFMRCGLLEYGFVHMDCPKCGFERLVAFSCKGRGFCPSCGGRRMADTAAHVVDHVVPRTPLRQWVLSFPFEMRYRLGYDRAFCDELLGTFMEAWMAEQRIRAKRVLGLASITEAHPGALLFVQRFDSALRMNVHAHVLALDGVYLEDGGGVRFAALPEPTTAELERVVVRMLRKLHERFGDELGVGDDEVATMASCYAASLQNQDLFGARAGQPTLRLVGLQPTPNDARLNHARGDPGAQVLRQRPRAGERP